METRKAVKLEISAEDFMVVPSLEDSQDIRESPSPPAVARPPRVAFVGPAPDSRLFGENADAAVYHNQQSQQRTYFVNDQPKQYYSNQYSNYANLLHDNAHAMPQQQFNHFNQATNQATDMHMAQDDMNDLMGGSDSAARYVDQFGAESSWLEESCDLQRSNSLLECLLEASNPVAREYSSVPSQLVNLSSQTSNQQTEPVKNPEDILDEIVREAAQYDTMQQEYSTSGVDEAMTMSNSCTEANSPVEYAEYESDGVNIDVQEQKCEPVHYQLQGVSSDGVVLHVIPVQLAAKPCQSAAHQHAAGHSKIKFKGKPPYKPAAPKPTRGRPKKELTLKATSKALLSNKEKKKAQNREAALRYRLKKRAVKNEYSGLLDEEEKRNNELQGQVHAIQQEIKYLKSLMNDMKIACV